MGQVLFDSHDIEYCLRVSHKFIYRLSSTGIDRRSVERHSTSYGEDKCVRRASKRGPGKSVKSKARIAPPIEEVQEVVAALETERTESINPIEVRLSISADIVSWATKSMELEVHSRDAVVQMTLDSFNLSEHRAADFALMQRTSSGDVELPAEPIPYFALNKSSRSPYVLYLRHKSQSEPPRTGQDLRVGQGCDNEIEAVRGAAERASSLNGADC